MLSLGSTIGFAGGMSSSNYSISDDVLSSGGTAMQSAEFVLQSTFGQASPVGNSISASYSNQAGFWHFLVAMGDVNGDGVIDLIDVIRVLHCLTGQSDEQLYRAADINGDGKLGLEELLYAMKKVAE